MAIINGYQPVEDLVEYFDLVIRFLDHACTVDLVQKFELLNLGSMYLVDLFDGLCVLLVCFLRVN